MSNEEAEKYVKKQSAKNAGKITVLYTGTFAVGAASGFLFVYKPLLGISAIFGSLYGSSKKEMDMKYKGSYLIGFTPAKYKQGIKNTISLNNSTIDSCKASIRYKESR